MQLHRIKVVSMENVQSREAAAARFILSENLFELAAAAAVRSHIRKDSTDALVELMNEVRDHLNK